jgi:SAM-dependent methyltransferase
MGRVAEYAVLASQHPHWVATLSRPDVFGLDPSSAALSAAGLFAREGLTELLELGAGQGRDTIFFATSGLHVHALDYAPTGISAVTAKAEAAGVGALVSARHHDVRKPLPFDSNVFDACFSHMLFCMALTGAELHHLAGEVRRILRPGGLAVYTVRTTSDPHYGSGVDHGDDLFENDGFIVRFFDRRRVDEIAADFELVDVAEFEEGTLPRRLFRVTMRRP